MFLSRSTSSYRGDTMNNLHPYSTVSFSGHRPNHLPDYGDISKPAMAALYQKLLNEIEIAILNDKTNFIHGSMASFDILAAEAVLQLKQKYPYIRLYSIVPFKRGFLQTKEWDNQWRNRAKAVFKQSDDTKTLEPAYSSGVYYRRNEWLVDHSSLLICYCNSNRGGTKMTMDYAASRDIPIINLNGAKQYGIGIR